MDSINKGEVQRVGHGAVKPGQRKAGDHVSPNKESSAQVDAKTNVYRYFASCFSLYISKDSIDVTCMPSLSI